MRFSTTILIVVFGLLALSVNAPSQEKVVAKPKFLDKISVGERFYIRTSTNTGRMTLFVPAEEELLDLTPTEEEKRQYEKVQKVLENARRQGNVEALLEDLPDDLKQLREKHGSLNSFAAKLREKMTTNIYTVSSMGEDYLAYRKDNQEVILSAQEIAVISRSIKK